MGHLRSLEIARIRDARTRRASSWDTSGRNRDYWRIEPGETRVLADLEGPGCITHIWMTQPRHYRECVLRFIWDEAPRPSIVVPLGDFFGLGHGLVNSYQSLWFSASTRWNHRFEAGCALNCYLPMPFRSRARVELVNESGETHGQYFYIDWERWDAFPDQDLGYLHAEFRRENPFGGWGGEIEVNTPEADVANRGRTAWRNNYVILDAKGRGQYVGCNLSVTNFQGTWWGEGDDMIWVDGYKWPPDLHGTGSEDYLGQAWGMQRNAFLRNGSSIFERDTDGYQTSYVFHVENPVRFRKEIRVTIEHGHANHLCNEMSSVAYWYADRPRGVTKIPSVTKRLAVRRDNQRRWIRDKRTETTSRRVEPTAEMHRMKARAAKQPKRQWP